MATFGGDRGGGGRESKNYARRVARGLNAKANPFAKKTEQPTVHLTKSQVAQRLDCIQHVCSMLDCGANLLSRQLQRDQARLFQRGFDEHVEGVISYTSDFDRMPELLSLIKGYPGRLYGAFGLGPDNVKKTFNEKWVVGKMTELRALALLPECVALWAGVDASTREVSSHFAQERTLELHLKLAADIKLPILITEAGAAERTAEKLVAWREECDALMSGAGVGSSEGEDWKDALGRLYVPRAAIFDFQGDARAMQGYLDAGAYIVLTGAVCDSGDLGSRLKSLVPKVPLCRLMVASNSPLHTPQNIPDAFVREMRNEPSNMPYILAALLECYNAAFTAGDTSFFHGLHGADGTPYPPKVLTKEDLAGIIMGNSTAFFGLPGTDHVGAPGMEPSTSGAGENKEGEGSDGEDDNELEGVDGTAGAAEEAHEGKEGEHSVSESKHADVHVTGLIYHCRLCRAQLFNDRDIQVHDGSGLRPSATSVATGVSGPAHDGGGGGGDAAAGGGGAKEGKKKGGKAGASASAAAPAASEDHDEVAFSKWRESKGKLVKGLGQEGACRMLLVDRQPWMSIPAKEPEGTIICPGPGCNAKLGQYNLAGLKCSCGLHVTPAFKIPKARVDAAVQGADAIDVLAALEARVGDRGGAGLGLALGGDEDDVSGPYGGGGPGDQSDEEGEGRKKNKKSKALTVPVSKHKGNFSEFRNKST